MVELREKDFSIEEVIGKMRSPKIGAVVTYSGIVRSFSEGKEVERLEFDPQDKIAIGELEQVRRKALENFDVEDVAIIHRVGSLEVSDNILLIAVSASRREPAFDACKYIVDNIKNAIHSIWRRERTKE